MAFKNPGTELGAHDLFEDKSPPYENAESHDEWNPFETHRRGPSGFDEAEYKCLQDLGYPRQIASRAILALGGQVIDFDYLFQLDLVHLQKQLVRDYTQICTDGAASDSMLQEMHEHLNAYSTTLRDYEEMLARPQRKVAPNWNLLDVFFPEFGLKSFKQKSGYPSAMHWMRSRGIRGYTGHTDFSEKQEEAIQRLKNIKQQRLRNYDETFNRFLVALFGGLAVIVPIIIMSFAASQTKSLVTVSVSVLLVALAIAVFSKASNQELIIATAAYAAVLVVFVGTGVGSEG